MKYNLLASFIIGLLFASSVFAKDLPVKKICGRLSQSSEIRGI